MKIQTFSSTIRRKEMDAVLTCLVEEKTGPGEMNGRLLQQVKETFGIDGAAALRSPSLALKYALKALDLPRDSGIIISALAPSWHYYAVKDLGYVPVVADVSPETGLINPESAADAIGRGGRLILLHETMGFMPNFTGLAELGIPIIEDISQSAGAAVGEKSAGTFGVFSILGLEDQDLLTAGGGAVLMASARRDWLVLKRFTDEAPSTDILPDINSALGYIQLKEMMRNELVRKEMYEMYVRSLMQGKHKTFSQQGDYAVPTVYSFPVVLSGSFKDIKQYAARKDIEISAAYEKSVIAGREEEFDFCIHARSLLLRCALFPLYPRLGNVQSSKIAKVLATLP